MPVYEYSCVECGEQFEQYRKVRTRSAACCPECGGRGQKVFHAVGIIFKGSGFHSTDYSRSGDGATSETPQSEDKSPAATAEKDGKSETERS